MMTTIRIYECPYCGKKLSQHGHKKCGIKVIDTTPHITPIPPHLKIFYLHNKPNKGWWIWDQISGYTKGPYKHRHSRKLLEILFTLSDIYKEEI